MRVYFLSQGSSITTALSVAAELGIADHLVDSPRSSADLAHATSTHPRALYRLLRLLCSVGVFTEIQPDSFVRAPPSKCLRAGVPESMRS